jgi:hypothetical protein
MGNVLNFLELLAMAVWAGAIIFFSFFTAPVLFGVLGKDGAGKVVRALFPRYYLLGVLCGAVLVMVQIGRGVLWYWGGMIKPAIVLFSILTLLSLYARQVLTPAVNIARDAGTAGKPRFDALHRRSLMLNGFVLLLLLLYLVWMAVRGF